MVTITQERIKQVCDYEPRTGELVWKEPGKKRIVGKRVGSTTLGGYLETCIDRKRYLVHRLVWLWHHGCLPPEHTDHINHNRSDNRIENLRAATNRENNFNQSKRRGSTTSLWRGVDWCIRRGRWRARLHAYGSSHHIGYFDCEEDAAMAWNAEALSSYGRFVNLNTAE